MGGSVVSSGIVLGIGLLAAGWTSSVIAVELAPDQSSSSTTSAPAAIPNSSSSTAASAPTTLSDHPGTAPAELQPAMPVATSPAVDAHHFTALDWLMLAAGPVMIWLVLQRGWLKLGTASHEQRWFIAPPLFALWLYIAMVILGRIGIGAAMSLLHMSQIDDPATLSIQQHTVLACMLYSFQGAAALLWLLWLRRVLNTQQPRDVVSPLVGRMSMSRAARIGLVALVIAWPIVNLASVAGAGLEQLLRHAPTRPIAHETLRLLTETPVSMWSVMLSGLVVLVAPLLEEFTYRGLLQGGLVQVGVPRWWAIAGVSVMFAAMHVQVVEPGALAALLVLSLAFGLVYERTGSLWASISMHMAFNGLNLLLTALLFAR